MSRKKCSRSCGIGGQAVLEGVMMKKGDLYAVTVRKPDGELVIDTEEFHGVMHGNKIKNVPFIRGIFNFVDSLILGTRTLTYSADFFEEEAEKETAMDRWFKKTFKDKAESVVSGLTVALSIVLAIAIFMVLPYFISSMLDTFIRNTTILAIFEGVIRLAIFVGYVVLISAMEDIKRVYMYHGAEHKCINCIERGRELNVKNKFALEIKGINSYQNSFELLTKDLKRWKKEKYRTVLLCSSRTRAKRLARDLQDEGLNAFYTDEESRIASPGEIILLHGNVKHGYEYPMLKFAVLAETDIFGAEKKKKKKKQTRYEGQKIQSFSELSIGDYVVHENHGLGVYKGIEKIEVDKVIKDYMKIQKN